MNYSIPVSALVYNFHANPDIHASENFLLVLGVLASVVEKDAVQEFLVVDLIERTQLDWCFSIAADCCLLLLISSD